MTKLENLHRKFRELSSAAQVELKKLDSKDKTLPLAIYLKLVAAKRFNEAHLFFQRNQNVLRNEAGKIWLDPLDMEIWNKR